ncbi:MAG: tol-pal system YbgF family protein [Candidatus Baltobacteraceae bacterium]
MHMRRAVFVALLAVLTGGAAAGPALAQPQHHRVAPADEYFGRLKMSILGMRNEIKDLSTRLSFNPDRGGELLGSALTVEDAIRDWEHKYPDDSWLPKSVYMLSQLYASIHTEEGQRRAAATLRWVIDRYPSTAYAATARSQVFSQAVK